MTRTSRLAALVVSAAAFASGLGLVCPQRVAAAVLPVQAEADDTGIRALLQRIEQAALQVDANAYLTLLTTAADRDSANDFTATEFRPGATRVILQERERQPLPSILPGTGYGLTVDAFMEYGDRARVATWQISVTRVDQAWEIAGQSRVSAVESLYRLSLNTTRQFAAKNFTVVAEDLELTLVDGSLFTIDTEQGTTGLVMLGHGEMRFHPAPRTEIEQVRIFAGADTLASRFDAAFIRLGTFDAHAERAALTSRVPDPRDVRRAADVFREESAKSFVVDLADLTRDMWSLLPGPDDFLAEIRTRRFDTLTYARSTSEAEDISFFDRRRHRNIAVYASKDKLAARGRFYDEDDLSAFDVLDYNIAVTSLPDRQWIDGHTTMRIRVRAPDLGQLTIRLADSLVVRSVVSNRFGRLFNLRVMNQDMILVNLPSLLGPGDQMTLRIDYSGRLAPQASTLETVTLGQQEIDLPPHIEDPFLPRPEANYLYSNRSYWYPQPVVSDYATATIEITVPASYGCVASGEPASYSPEDVSGGDAAQARRLYTYTAARPVRYLAFLVTRLTRADRWTVAFDHETPTATSLSKDAADRYGPAYPTLDLIVETNPRQAGRGRDLAERAVDVMQFYESLVGDSPYSTFTLALLESTLPGGHSPGYFAALNQPLATAGVSWRNDPAAFSNYPEFFLAHEAAHQWWGQAIGWRNYHEQWLSEGFAQYFAALYAQHLRGQEVFDGVMGQMRRWAANQSEQGPVYLGYRVGHIKNDGRAFRAVVYDKGAVVLHMLRQLVGDEAFFGGIRQFYGDWRFRKASTDDFRRTMEKASGRSLDRFFERWIYNSTLPRLSFSYRIETPQAEPPVVVLHFEQLAEVFDLPVTVTLKYADRRQVNVVVPVTGKVVDVRVPLQGTLREAEVNRDETLVEDVEQP